MNDAPAYPRPVWLWKFVDQIERFPILGLLMAGFVATLLYRPIFDVDIFWQLRLGDLALDTGRIPENEPFVLPEGRPHVPICWLAQVIYAALRRVGGWQLAQVVDACVWLGGLAAVALAVCRNTPRAWPVAAALWLGFAMAMPQASLRPQSFALLSFGLLIALVKSDWAAWKKVLFGGLVLVFWQNAHPSVVTGGAYLGVVAAVGWGRYFWRRTAPPPWATTLLVPLAAAAVFATPAGTDVIATSAYNAEICLKLDIPNTGEWHGLWDQESRHYWDARDWDGLWNWQTNTARVSAAGLLLLTLGALVVRGRRVALEDLAAFLVFAVLMAVTYRFVLFWSALLIPVWASILSPRNPLPPLPRPIPGRWRMLAVAGVLAVAVPLATKPGQFMDAFPFAGIERLQAEGVRGTIYSHFEWGGVLADAGHRDWKLTHDGRYYLLSEAEWLDHFAALEGKRSVDDLEAKHRPTAFFLRPGWGNGLIAKLRAHPHWRELYSDATCAVFVRR